jgi:hypothetical protein
MLETSGVDANAGRGRRLAVWLGAAVVAIALAVVIGLKWDWIGERVGPSCVLTSTQAGAKASITIQGWKSNDVCSSYLETHDGLVRTQGSHSGASMCEVDRVNVRWIVRDPTGEENGRELCASLAGQPE